MNNIKLYRPQEAATQDSLLLLWDKPTNTSNPIEYQIYVNNQLTATTFDTDYTLTNLSPDTFYDIRVESLPLHSETITAKTKPFSLHYDITHFGAIGDGKHLNTENIQETIEQCPPGGTVYVPAGKYLTGALFLKSNMTLYLDDDAELIGSSRLCDYPAFTYRYEGTEQLCYASLINMPYNAPNADVSPYSTLWENVTICGHGTINANGTALLPQELGSDAYAKRGNAVCIRNTKDLYLYGVTIREAAFWCLHPIYCNHITMNQIRIENRCDTSGNLYGLVNGDGIDPDSCSNVNIVHSFIESQDDCIAIKSGRDEEGRRVAVPSRNYRITNCQFSHGFGVAIGSEMSAGVSDVLVQDCTFHNSFSIGSVKNRRGRGGIIERITYDHCRLKNYSTEHTDCRWFRGAIYIDQFYGIDNPQIAQSETISETTPTIRDVTFQNVELETIGGNAIYICGLPENHLTGITLKNINAKGRDGIKIFNTDTLILDDVSIQSIDV